jgi:hypothetical protein|tara:strand:- start:78299 stop:78568 length:270 start_codon:yes stop_codon:yes gene_type:complete
MESVNPWVPALIIMFANLFGGKHNNQRYEFITAVFGWLAGFSLIIYFVLDWINLEFANYFLQVGVFSLITAVTRDYERILKPLFDKKDI